jgi:DNA repair protein RadC
VAFPNNISCRRKNLRALGTKPSGAHNCHCHPSGISSPSHADEHITRRLKEALALVDIRVLDHFVVGETISSFAELGIL